MYELHSVEKREILSHQNKKFRQINSLVTYLVKPLLSRNFCQRSKCEREFPKFPHCAFMAYGSELFPHFELLLEKELGKTSLISNTLSVMYGVSRVIN